MKNIASCFGGRIADYPDHAKTRISASERSVNIKITTWKENCFEAMHFYPSITFGNIPFLDEKENVYRRCWDDPSIYAGTRIEPDPTGEDGFNYTYDEKKAGGLISVERAKEWLDYMIAKLDLTSRISECDKTEVQQEVDYWTGK